MSQNTYCSPRLLINNQPIESSFSAKIDIKGGNVINKCELVVNTTQLKHYKLLNEEVEIYANIGSIDNIPIFRGYITKVKPSDTKIQITCSDPRYFLSGPNSIQFTADDINNADGMTIVQFLQKWIKDNVNTDKEYIGLNMLRETEPTITMDGFRTNNKPVYSIISRSTKMMKGKTDKGKKPKVPISYEIVMIDDGNISHIHFLKEKSLNTPPAMRFSNYDGIVKLSYKNVAKPTFALVGKTKFKVGNEPNGRISLGRSSKTSLPRLDRYSDVPGNISNEVLEEIERIRIYDNKNISLTATKGHYLALGDIVFLDVEDPELRGPHKVTGKTVSIGTGNMNVNLKLNDRIETLEEAEGQ